MLSPRSVQPRCELRAEEHCEAAGRRCVTIQQDRMQFRRLNAYAAECNSVSLWIMNIHLSRSFYACFSLPPFIPLYFGSWGLQCVNLAQSSSAATCFVFQLPADSSLSNPPWPIYKPHVQATHSLSKANGSSCISNARCFGYFFAAAPVMTHSNNRANTTTRRSCGISNVTVSILKCMCETFSPREQAGGLPGHKWWDENDCFLLRFAGVMNEQAAAGMSSTHVIPQKCATNGRYLTCCCRHF